MAEQTTTSKDAPKAEFPEFPEFAKALQEQFVTTVRQGQQLTLDAARAWAKAASALPAPELPAVPGVPGLREATESAFDAAIEFLTAQRQFAVDLVDALTTPKSS
jgi:hypothetical protein